MTAFFITGIGTEVGKTVVSAFLCKALRADYWKPIQSGDLHHTDTQKVKSWAGLTNDRIHPEAYRLTTPASPHFSATQDGVIISVPSFNLPATENTLIVEGAGGLFVPLNGEQTILDLIKHLSIPVILVARNYLGSINHTLLSIHALRSRDIPLAGLIFSGADYRDNVDIISQQSGVEPLLQLPEAPEIQPQRIGDWVADFGEKVREQLL
ncbi:MAG: dethiobiotin synthase [Bacteroidota bacterium]